MFCPACANELRPGARFCGYCGSVQSKSETSDFRAWLRPLLWCGLAVAFLALCLAIYQVLQSPERPAVEFPLTVATLQNSTYRLPFPDQAAEQVQFVNGKGSSGSDHYEIDGDHVAFGDLDGDGVDDIAATVSQNGGGSGTFVYLVAFLNEKGVPRSAALTPLGDRSEVRTIVINGGRITADFLAHGSNDAMCCPTRRMHRTWILQGGRLVVSR